MKESQEKDQICFYKRGAFYFMEVWQAGKLFARKKMTEAQWADLKRFCQIKGNIRIEI